MSDRTHVLCCDEAHGHRPPECCAFECWCIAEAPCPCCNADQISDAKMRAAHIDYASKRLDEKRKHVEQLTREADAYERQIRTFERKVGGK